MWTLEFKPPYPIKKTWIYKGDYLDNPAPQYYNRFCTVFTKYGIVTVCDFDWATNTGMCHYTEFSTVINEMLYRADLKESRLSDLRIKWMATHFMKKVIDRDLVIQLSKL